MFEQYVPDLDLFSEAWTRLTRASQNKASLENRLEEIKASIYLDCMQNEAYFINGKQPAVSFIDNSYAKIGHTPEVRQEIKDIKAKLVDLIKEIDEAKAAMRIEEIKLNLFQTMSANTRNVAGF